MKIDIQNSVDALFHDADLAADPSRNGLLDRVDLQQIIARLSTTVRRLQVTCEQIKRDRDALVERLQDATASSAHPSQYPSGAHATTLATHA